MNYYICLSGHWLGPVKNPVELADGWLGYGQTGQGRIKAGNWRKEALKPAPLLGSAKVPSIPRIESDPALLLPDSERCFCLRCCLYFRDGAAFTAHQIPLRPEGPTRCAADDKERRHVGLRLYSIRGRDDQEWGL